MTFDLVFNKIETRVKSTVIPLISKQYIASHGINIYTYSAHFFTVYAQLYSVHCMLKGSSGDKATGFSSSSCCKSEGVCSLFTSYMVAKHTHTH